MPALSVMTIDECERLLRRGTVGRLVLVTPRGPDIFPVNYVVDHGTVVFRTAEGTKLATAVLGPAVAFAIDGYDAKAGDAWSVVLKGRASEVQRMRDVVEATELPLFPWHTSPKPRFVRIEPESVTGRRFHARRTA